MNLANKKVFFIKNGDVVEEYKKLSGEWKENSIELIWDIAEVGKIYNTMIASSLSQNNTGFLCYLKRDKNENVTLWAFIYGSRYFLVRKTLSVFYNIILIKEILRFKPHIVFFSDLSFLFIKLLIFKLLGIIPVINFSRETQLRKFIFFCVRFFKIRNCIVPEKVMKKVLESNRIQSDIYVRTPKYPSIFFETPNFISDFPTNHDFNFIFVGRFIKSKGIFEILEAAKKILVEYKNIGLVLIGDGEVLEDMKKFISDNNMSNNVHLLGNKANTEIGKYLNKSQVLIFPTYTEGFSKLWNESILIGIPMITTPLLGIKDILKNKESVVYVEPGSVDSLYIAMKELYSNNELRKKIAENLKKINLNDYTSRTCFKDCVLQIIDKTLRTQQNEK